MAAAGTRVPAPAPAPGAGGKAVCVICETIDTWQNELQLERMMRCLTNDQVTITQQAERTAQPATCTSQHASRATERRRRPDHVKRHVYLLPA